MPFQPGVRISSAAFLLIAISVALSGCAATYNSGIQERAPGTYFLSIRTVSVDGGSTVSRQQAVAQADEYCGKSGKKAVVTTEEVGPVTADIYFVCEDM